MSKIKIPKKESEGITIEQKKQQLLDEIVANEREIITKCTQKVNEVLDSFGCALNGSFTFVQGQSTPRFTHTVVLKRKK